MFIIKNIDNSKFEYLQCVLFELGCIWVGDNSPVFYEFNIDDDEVLLVDRNIIFLKGEIELENKNYIQYNATEFLRLNKMKKLLT